MRRLLTSVAATVAPGRFGAQAPPSDSATMAAVVFDRHGSADVLRFDARHPRPRPGPSQSLLRIHAAGLNPVDYKMRFHDIPEWIYPLPKIPGTDLAGEVAEPAKGSRFAANDRVYGMLPLLGTRWGACAQYVAAEDRFLAAAPRTLDDPAAAALPLVSLTVLQGLASFERECKGGAKGKRALIHSGSGGVGSIAVQYCSKVLGMEVLTTCSAENRERVKALGAAVAIDYRKERFEEVARGCDLVFDPWGYEERTIQGGMLRAGGHYVRIASSHEKPDRPGRWIPEAQPHRLLAGFARQAWRNATARWGWGRFHYKLVFVQPDGAMLERVARLVEEGLIEPLVDKSFPLEETASAHRYLESGAARGKVVLLVP